MEHKRAISYLLLCATLWSMGGVLIKTIDLHPLAIAGTRSAIAAVVLAVYVRRFNFVWTKAQLGAARFFSYTVLSFVAATKLTTAANAILLQFTAPIYVAVFSGPLLGEKVGKRDIIALIAIVCGLVVFFLEKVSPENMLGNAIALSSGLSFAGIAICLRMQNGSSTLESLLLGHVLTAMIGLPVLLLGPVPSLNDSLALLVLGVFQLGIPYILYGIALRSVTALEATLVPVIEPILNPIWVALVTSERPSKFALIGGSIVLGSVAWHSFQKFNDGRKASRAKRDILPPAAD
jgi:drug/metabolite transporter (DMT)-like permease